MTLQSCVDIYSIMAVVSRSQNQGLVAPTLLKSPLS